MSENLFSVAGKVVVITGGLGQLGRQFCHTFLEGGARVAIIDNRCDEAAVREHFGERAGEVLGLAADITSRDALVDCLDRIRGELGAPDVLINNAALDSPPNSPPEECGPFETYPGDSWDKVMSVNTKGVLFCCQVFGGGMAESGGGSIINISSIYGLVSPDQRIYEYRRESGNEFFKPVAYSASKSALFNLTRYMATYWGPKKVRVNSVTFGGVFNEQDETFLANYSAKVPMGRMAQQDEYNGAMLFLASGASSYMTGSNLVIDGGYTAW